MVFEKALSSVLNSVLGDFVENLDGNQLNVGIWGGDVQLKNLVLKPSALDELDLPVQTVYGTIGNLVLKIPWKSLYSSPTVIIVEDIYLLAQPNQQVKYDPIKEEKKRFESKKKEIQKVEDAKKAEAEKGQPKADATFVEKLITSIIKNIQLTIKNIHIRYEDKVTNPKSPFSLGVTLSELLVESTDSNWKKAIVDDISKIYKIVQLDGLSIYWNCNSKLYGDIPHVDMLYKMKDEIASKQKKPSNYKYVLGPINSSARLRMNQNPENDSPPFSLPKIHLNLDMEKLFIGISKAQYRDIIALADSMNRMSKGVPYRKYRPDLQSYKGHYKDWWQFAYKSIVEEHVRRKKREWDWNHILQYRSMCREYRDLFSKALQKKSMKPEEKTRLEQCEKTLDLTNIVIIRQRIELETERLSKVQEKAQKKGWLGWMWGSSSQTEIDELNKGTALLKQFESEMTPEEKHRLYKAIDYQENAAPASYPEAFIDNSSTFLLRTLELELRDDDNVTKTILYSNLKTVRCKLETRPAASAIKIHIKIDDFTITGMKQEEFLPEMVTSIMPDRNQGLLEVIFETNPLDGDCDQKLDLIAQPIKIVYDSKTINKIVDVFTIPSDTTLDQIQAAAGSKLTDVKQMTSTGLQYAIDKHIRLDINIDLHAPYVVVPYGGKYTGTENVLVANLGRLKIFTFGKRTSSADVRTLHDQGKDQEEILKYMIENSYDNFRLELNDLQILMANSDENWESAIKESETSNMHLLNPLSLMITYSKSVIVDDPRLPLSKVTGELPQINIQMSEARLLLLAGLFYSIELPSSDVPEPQPLSKLNRGSSMILNRYKELQDSAKQTHNLLSNLPKTEEGKDFLQFTTIEAKFIMSELSIILNKQETTNSPTSQLAVFKINSLKCSLKQQTYNTNVSLFLESMSLKQNREGHVIDIISTPITSADQSLFKVEFIQVNTKSPELHSTFGSCETSLFLNFGILEVILHQEGLLSLLKFSAVMQEQIEDLQNVHKRDRVGMTTDKLYVIEEHLEGASQKSLPKTKKKKIPKVVETIKFKLDAKLLEVTVKFATDASSISTCAIRGIDTTIIVKDTYTQVNAQLQEMTIIDLNPLTHHNVILCCTEGTALYAQVVLNNLDIDSEKPDIEVCLKMGGLKIVFLNWFISNMLNFLNQFQAAQQAVIDASHAAAQSAKEITKDAYSKATRILLKIHLKAPDIIVPVNSTSNEALLLDLGVINLSNTFTNVQVPDEEHVPVVDNLKVILRDLKVLRVKIQDNGKKIMKVCNLLEPVTFNLLLNRSLSSWYNLLPDLEVLGSIEMIELRLSKSDYAMIMSILSGNLSEGKIENPSIEPKSAPVSSSKIKVEIDSHAITTISEEVVDNKGPSGIFLKFRFTMDRLVINLYSGGPTELTESSICHDAGNHLARFQLEGFSLKGRIYSDQSIVTSILLVDCLLDDMRKGREDKLNRLIERKRDTAPIIAEKPQTDSISSKSMVDITFQQKKNQMFADIRVYSIMVILSVDYLIKIADIFSGPDGQSDINKGGNHPTTKLKDDKLKEMVPQEIVDNSQLTVSLKLEKPDIILVEHMDNIDTNAMILNGEVILKLRLEGSRQVINGNIKEVQVYTCNYNPLLRANTRSDVLYPVNINVAGSTPEDKGLHVEVIVTKVHLSVSPATIELLNRILVTMQNSDTNKEVETIKEFELDNLWEQKTFSDTDYWFLKTECGTDVLDIMNYPAEVITPKSHSQELCIISINSITITVEAGVGNKTLPMLILETGFNGIARNWSTQLSAEATVVLQMGYYNSRLALWEPLIEPIDIISEQNNKQIAVPWELKFELVMNQEQDDNMSSMSPTSEIEAELQLPQPAMDIDIVSDHNLEITITKTFLDVLENLNKAFADAVNNKKIINASGVYSPFKVFNEIGEDITLMLEVSSFEIAEGGVLEDINKSEAVPLQLKSENAADETLHLGKELASGSRLKDYSLHIKVNNKNCELNLPVVRADKRFFPLNYKGSSQDNWGIISDIKVDEGVTIITIRSILQVYNHFNVPIDVYYMTPKGNELELIGEIQPNSVLNVPLKAVYNPTNELFFSVSGYSITNTPYMWKDLQANLSVTKLLHCANKKANRSFEPFIIKAIGEMEQVYYENTSRHTMASACYNIHLRPAVMFKNCLPLNVVCCIDEQAEEYIVEAGDTLPLSTVDPGKNNLVIRLPHYLEKEWSCRREIDEKPDEFEVWTFASYDSPTKMSLDLGMHTLDENGSVIMTLYCPFWMLNKTGLMIGYRSSDENLNVLHHPAHFKGPILFSFNAKNFFGKKKASIRVESGEWSDKFSLDVAGSSGVISCKNNDTVYQIGVHNQLTYNSLSKQITFTPYYVIINNASFPIDCQESERSADPWVTIEPKSCSALWPKSDREDKLMRIRVHNTDEISAPFMYTESHNTLLKLNNKYGGINVDIQLTEGAVYINFAAYEHGSAPALLLNHTNTNITFWEKDSLNKRVLQPKHSILYTWENPSGPRILVWDRGDKKEIMNDLCKDTGGEFSPSDDLNICWATFLDSMQRVLLFTEDRNIVEGAQISNLLEVIQQEITVSIHGVGVSLVNNTNRQEIMYVGIASSGVIWETCRMDGRRYKQLGAKESAQIESAYRQYLSKENCSEIDLGRIVVDNKIEVDFKSELMFKPHKKKIRRTFQTGLWMQMKTSPSQMQLHAKVNRLQIDNQMFDCIFPIVLAPIHPPKSVSADCGIKPFIEVSIVQMLLRNSQIKQYKYFKVLVQEFHIKLDLGFINAVLDLLQKSQYSEEEERELFLKDTKLVEEALYSHASSQSIQEQKSFYDVLHFSPFKIHISFSMAAGTSPGQNASTPNVLNILLQGVGVTLTDMQDVVFKLAYFERNYTFLTQKQLINEAIRHYTGQAVKQLYVLVLGLDVIGNPYGLVLGLTKGVGDLFYEPYQGAIQGPGEFAEGLALGVKSLFGHTVGGAAGAMSRITGAMGKGIAALTFDDDFQRKRREQLNKKPASFQEGIARSSKGLVMGVYSGVTGVFTKPVAGAKEQGVEGFFKGLGKGAVGLVTRPVAGVVDFASGSLDVVKRATEAGEDTMRLRPPRFLQADGLVRPYNREEAEGHKLLMELSKGKYGKTDIYVSHYTIISKKEVLLLTNKRMAYICHNDIFGGWQVEWTYTWDEIRQPAKVVHKGVLISTSKEKKKLFGSNDTSKTILVGNPAVKEEICLKIECLRHA